MGIQDDPDHRRARYAAAAKAAAAFAARQRKRKSDAEKTEKNAKRAKTQETSVRDYFAQGDRTVYAASKTYTTTTAICVDLNWYVTQQAFAAKYDGGNKSIDDFARGVTRARGYCRQPTILFIAADDGKRCPQLRHDITTAKRHGASSAAQLEKNAAAIEAGLKVTCCCATALVAPTDVFFSGGGGRQDLGCRQGALCGRRHCCAEYWSVHCLLAKGLGQSAG